VLLRPFEKYSAAKPETKGAAIDVPVLIPVFGDGLLQGRKLEVTG
jgi:hypothetical protein